MTREPEPNAADQYAQDTWKYAIDEHDIVVCGVVYDGREWMRDGEGGVMRRAEWRAEQGIADEDAAAEDDSDPIWEVATAEPEVAQDDDKDGLW